DAYYYLSGLTNHIQKSSILEIIGAWPLWVADENAPYHHANENQGGDGHGPAREQPPISRGQRARSERQARGRDAPLRTDVGGPPLRPSGRGSRRAPYVDRWARCHHILETSRS